MAGVLGLLGSVGSTTAIMSGLVAGAALVAELLFGKKSPDPANESHSTPSNHKDDDDGFLSGIFGKGKKGATNMRRFFYYCIAAVAVALLLYLFSRGKGQ